MKKLLIVLTILSLFTVKSHAAVTANDIISQVRIMVSDNNSNRQKWTDSQLFYFINQGQRDIANNTWVFTGFHQFELVAGTTEYNLPADFSSMVRVTFRKTNMAETSKDWLDSNRSYWETTTGLPTYYYLYYSSYANIGFYSAPAGTSTGTVKCWYNCSLTAVTVSTSPVFNSWAQLTPWQHLLVDYVVYRCLLRDRRTSEATLYYQEYAAGVTKLKETMFTRPNYHPSAQGDR